MSSRRERFERHLGALTEPERIEKLHTVVGQIYLAVEGVSLQAKRLRDSHSMTNVEHQSDAIFFVFALHRLLVLLDLARDIAPEPHATTLGAAVERLRATAGDTKGARDVLTHSDEYLTGVGQNRDQAGDRPLPWFERDGTRYTVRVGAYAISVDEAEEAAHQAFAAAYPLDDLGRPEG